MVLGGVGWDRKEFLESNLHVYGRDDTKIVVYSMGRCTKKKKEEKKERRNQVILTIGRRTLVTLFINKTLYKLFRPFRGKFFLSYLCLIAFN